MCVILGGPHEVDQVYLPTRRYQKKSHSGKIQKII